MKIRKTAALFGAGAIATISAAALAQNAPPPPWRPALTLGAVRALTSCSATISGARATTAST